MLNTRPSDTKQVQRGSSVKQPQGARKQKMMVEPATVGYSQDWSLHASNVVSADVTSINLPNLHSGNQNGSRMVGGTAVSSTHHGQASNPKSGGPLQKGKKL